MTRTVVVSIILSLAASACGPSGHEDTDEPMTIVVSPASATLDVIGAVPVRHAFTATAHWADGDTTDVTDRVAWAIDDRFGRFEANELVSNGPVAGQTTATAELNGVIGTADVTIRITNVRVDPSTGAPPNAPDLFGPGSTIDPARAPAVVYPADRVVIPSNIGDFDVHWTDTVGNDVWEVSLKSVYVDVRVYVGASSPRWLAFTPDEWAYASGSPEVAFDVRGAVAANPGTVGAGTPRTAVLSDQATMGGLYYWAASSTMGGPEGIFRHDMSRPGQPAEQYYTNVEAGRCVACHVLSRDGTKMAVTYDTGDGPATLLDVRTRTALPSMGAWNYGTYTPSGDRLITATAGRLDIRDPVAGLVMGSVPAPTWATQPDFSPTGNLIAYAGDATKAIPSYNISFTQGAIIVQPYDAAGGTYGAPNTIVPAVVGQNNYYPSVSPDGNWVLFNRSTGDSYDDPDAELWVVSSAGGTPLKLDIANIGSGLTNSWTRWAPFAQTVAGEPVFWITFSSKRDFGVRLVGQNRPQIWMSAFFPGRAAAGMDPTGPSFRLPFQDLSTNNHIAQWTEQIIPIE